MEGVQESIHLKKSEYWIPARKLDIYLIDDDQCWKWITHVDRTEVAELLKVKVLDIKGSYVNPLHKKAMYSAYIVFKLRECSHGLEHLKASVNGKEYPVVFLPRKDGWIEIKLGDFFNGEAEMRLYDTDEDYWKSGLLVKGIEVRQTSISN